MGRSSVTSLISSSAQEPTRKTLFEATASPLGPSVLPSWGDDDGKDRHSFGGGVSGLHPVKRMATEAARRGGKGQAHGVGVGVGGVAAWDEGRPAGFGIVPVSRWCS
jgi:hypothetical protein